SLCFQFVNRALPDPASPVGEAELRESIRFAISAVIVALPVFLFVFKVTNRAAERDPTERVSPVRRWLTYLTLFITACVLIGDVTTLIYSLLGGELTARFVLKVLIVGVLAGMVFGYYLSDLRLDEKEAAA
ncbi:MAG: DUF5671 domain-containing protein, partial [Acidobacteriota bacterium]